MSRQPTSRPSATLPLEQQDIPFYTGATLCRANSIGWLMKQAIAGLTRELQERMTTLDVTPAQWPVLLIMSQAASASAGTSVATGKAESDGKAPTPTASGPAFLEQPLPGEPTAIDLARQLSMDAGAMTRMLDRMSEKGLIERNRCALDRRATRLALTDSGRETVRPIAEVLASTLNAMLRGFSREEFETLLALLKRLDANCQSFPSSAAGTADADASSGRRSSAPASAPASASASASASGSASASASATVSADAPVDQAVTAEPVRPAARRRAATPSPGTSRSQRASRQRPAN